MFSVTAFASVKSLFRAQVVSAAMRGEHQVVEAQLDALQRNDWPESDAGIAVAFAFSKPHDAESLLPGEVPATARF